MNFRTSSTVVFSAKELFVIATLRRFFDDVHRIADCVAANRMQDVLVTLKPEQIQEVVEALPLYRRRKVQA